MKGKIIQWKDDKGFGFIQPDNGYEKLLFHVSNVKTNARRPQVGDIVLYEVTRDSQNRLNAKRVIIEGVRQAVNKRQVRVEPPRKNIVDYVLLLIAFVSIALTGLEFYRTSSIEASWFLSIPAVLALLILNRQKQPKEKTFCCFRCKKVAQHDSRTVQAWNNKITKLYCRACHLQWLKDNPKQERAHMQSQGSGCLGMLVFMAVIPALGGRRLVPMVGLSNMRK